jgi:hypothetical protein
MEKLDFKKADRAFYTGKAGRFDRLTLPSMRFLMIDGEGDPNNAPAYARAAAALYALSYGLKFHGKQTLGQDHAVGPLEGLWWADDMETFVTRDKAAWKWTMCIRQPTWVSGDVFEEIRSSVTAKQAKKKDAATDEATLARVRLEDFEEGDVVQVLHIGSYDDEAPVLAHMHGEVIPGMGLAMRGLHHEIYLSDPRRVAPEKLRTILRQPVEALSET